METNKVSPLEGGKTETSTVEARMGVPASSGVESGQGVDRQEGAPQDGLIARAMRALGFFAELGEGAEAPAEFVEASLGARQIARELLERATVVGGPAGYSVGSAIEDLYRVAAWLKKNPQGIDAAHVNQLVVVAEILENRVKAAAGGQ